MARSRSKPSTSESVQEIPVDEQISFFIGDSCIWPRGDGFGYIIPEDDDLPEIDKIAERVSGIVGTAVPRIQVTERLNELREWQNNQQTVD